MMTVPMREIAINNKAVHTAVNAAALSEAAWFMRDAETQATMKAIKTKTREKSQA